MCGCRHHWDQDAPCTCTCPEHTLRQDADGSWSPAKPLPMQGLAAKLEERLRRRGWRRLPNLLARWDERGLG